MMTMKHESDDMSRREFLKRGVLGALSLMTATMMGSSLLSACSKEDDENDLAEQDEEVEEEQKKKKQNT